MRILLAHNSLYYPSHGGGDKSNRLLMEALAARGHPCCVVARLGSFDAAEQERFLSDLAARGIQPISDGSGAVVFEHGGVEVHVLAANRNLRAYFAERISDFEPSVVLASTDDPAQMLLDPALRAERARVVYLVRATLAVPFGPDCAFPSAEKTEMLRQVDGVVGVSRYVAGYVRRWSGIEAAHVPISLMDPGPYPRSGRFDNEFVTLVNPCAVKGISVFLALADRMPEVQFAAVPTWGTNAGDLRELGKRPNVRILDPVDDIDLLLARTRVLLAPSLWAEARSRIIVEAMLRGVPVVASDIGGIPEAKMGVPYLLPVRPIRKYRPSVDEHMVPVAEVPPQDIGPWHEALEKLSKDPSHYEEISAASREAALSYVASLDIGPFESYLERVVQSPRRERKINAREANTAPGSSTLDRLSPEKRHLLALRLRKQTAPASSTADLWFPGAASGPSTRLRLFCFPYAGGGSSSFHGWADQLPSFVAVCPARLPGRESRLAEAPARQMPVLVDALTEAVLRYTGEPYALFGNSMGAAVAFELARNLRRKGHLLPLALFVAGARAPQFRRGHAPPPEPSEPEFVEEVRRLEGIPRQVLDHPELMRVILPALRADTALYRNYVYEEEEPLSCSIRAYGGADDPNVTAGHLEAWKEQTTSSFSMRMFNGGHFFTDTARSAFLAALAGDLEQVLRSVAAEPSA